MSIKKSRNKKASFTTNSAGGTMISDKSKDKKDEPLWNETDENVKTNDIDIEIESDNSDSEVDESDKELQIALRDGLLKSDALNYIVEKKRPVINKTEELKLKIGEFQKRMPWIETLDITVENEMNTMHNKDDDFEREIIFYKQAKKAAEIAIQRLKQMKMKVFRPSDYFAEMVKSDTHMQKVRQRIADIREGKERQENIRRLREEKKFAAKVQREVIENRQNEKKKLKEAVMKHRKGLKGQLEEMLNNAKSLQIYDDKTDAASHLKKKDNQMRNGVKCSKLSRNARNKKFGFGGQKKRSKNNTKESFNEFVFPGTMLMNKKGRIINRKGIGSAGGQKRKK